jgi:hydroxyethylthiazole kinase-like uncharacterized protein yjeF
MPIPIDADAPPQPLFDTAATRRLERTALDRVPPGTLVRRAGLAVAKLALALRPDAQRIWVVAGPGNNGADGLDAAARLQAAGVRVDVHLVAERACLGAQARDALARALAAGVDVVDGPPASAPACDLVIDALLGIGLSRAPEGALAQAIGAANAVPVPRLAVDVPSGLDADRGIAVGAAIVATHTLTMLTLKPGLFTAQGRDHAGQVWFADLDESDSGETAIAWLAAGGRPAPPRRHAQHKGSFGDVVVVGGAPGMVGATWLAARGALAAGAGRVYASLLDAAAPHWHAAHPELMGRPRVWIDHLPLLRAATVVCGCGGGDAVRDALPAVLSAAPRLVLDADALNAVAADASLRHALRTRHHRGAATVLTPHPLEAGRLLGRSAADVQADRLACARALADEFGAVVVLKGSGTVTAAPASVPWINLSGNASLATAGTGDVLAGWLGGSWAATGAADLAALQALCADVVARHGRAADRHGAATPLRAGALIEAMLRA